MVTRAALAAAIVLTLTGCAPIDVDKVMGRTDGTATTAPKLLDCDLIFPAPAQDSIAP